LKTGLFSAIVAAFIALSLPQLSPNSGDQTVALLSQLVSISTGAPVVVQNTPFKAPASIVRANVMWFLSLILSLSCALLATLMQQWARRFRFYAQHRGGPRKRARIRAYMFEGVKSFGMSKVVETMPFLLHTSVFLFFAGIIEFLLPINKVVAFSTLGCVLVFTFIYAILTLLPSWRLNCPYRTPLSGFTHFSFHFLAFNLFLTVKAIEGIFHGLLLKIWRWSHTDVQRSANHWPSKWRVMLEKKVCKHHKRLDGLQKSIELGAMEASSSVDASALHWTLTTLDEDKEFEDFAARMPGFFDSRAPPDATSAMLSLLSEKPTSNHIFGSIDAPSRGDACALLWTLTALDEDKEFEDFSARISGFFDSHVAPNATSAMLFLMSKQPTSGPVLVSRLRELLGTCIPGASLLTEEQRNRRLRVCLTSLWYCLREYNLPKNSEVPLAKCVHAIFASRETIRWLRTEQDPVVRLLGHCFGSLVVKKLANDIISPTHPSIVTDYKHLARLSYILGANNEKVRDWLGQEGAIDLANVNSLTSAEMETLVDSGTKGVPTDVVDVFQQTLSILAEGIISSHPNIVWDTDQVEVFHKIYEKISNARVPLVLKERLRHISDRLPSSDS
jgi:hypothetical protein